MLLGCADGSADGSAEKQRSSKAHALSFPIHIDIVNGSSGELRAGKLHVEGLDGLANPTLGSSTSALVQSGQLLAGNQVYSLSGDIELSLPAGRYRLSASMGMFWTIAQQDIQLPDDADTKVTLAIEAAVDQTNWRSADFHVHARPSFDSKVALASRVLEFYLEGVDIMVATDHNMISDYRPAIEELQLTKHITSVIGDELSTYDWGHFGAYPLPESAVGEAFGAQFRRKGRPNQLFKTVRSRFADALLQVNHPRVMHRNGYFQAERFSAEGAGRVKDGFSLDFDVLELVNGNHDFKSQGFDEVLQDWFALLRAGHRITATGNSDTHRLSGQAGIPRNLLWLPETAIDELQPAQIARAVAEGRCFLTTGPFLRFEIAGRGLGETIETSAPVEVHIAVEAAPWIPIHTVRVYRNGEPWREWPVDKGADKLRFETRLQVPAEDAFYVLRVDGGKRPRHAGRAGHGVPPVIAISNPIYVRRLSSARP